MNVIGFDVQDDERAALAEVARAGKGKYYNAATAAELIDVVRGLQKELKQPVRGLPTKVGEMRPPRPQQNADDGTGEQQGPGPTGGGSDDIGDVSWNVPTVTLRFPANMPGGPGQKWEAHPEGFSYASELVRLVCELGDFCVGVAAFPEKHPESIDFDSDAQRLVEKFEAGADFAVTQFFFDADDYFRLRDNVVARGCDKPILPGIMPVTNVKQIQRMAELSGAA